MDDQSESGRAVRREFEPTDRLRPFGHYFNILALLDKYLEDKLITQAQYDRIIDVGRSILAEAPDLNAMLKSERWPLQSLSAFVDSSVWAMRDELLAIAPHQSQDILSLLTNISTRAAGRNQIMR